ncbi:MAG: class I SAM-dependent methyltransferase [Gammaproteobacteria bacterium]|nr:class I SAM-dependent methyltransferase [Gammaproteobacteria bacterium]
MKEKLRLIETVPDWSDSIFDTCSELAELLEQNSYNFAFTMPSTPHCYTLKRSWPSEEAFVEALRKMRAVERVEEFFRGSWYRRFNANGYKYWTMGANLDHVLINRATHAAQFDPYTVIADYYDLGFHKKQSDVERSKRVYELLPIQPETEILDIGCGTGTLVDFRFKHIRPEQYTGVDPSREDPMHFQQSHRHVDQIRFVAFAHHRVNDFVQLRVLRFNQIEPRDINVLQRPGVLELRPCSFTPDRSRVVRFGIKGGI